MLGALMQARSIPLPHCQLVRHSIDCERILPRRPWWQNGERQDHLIVSWNGVFCAQIRRDAFLILEDRDCSVRSGNRGNALACLHRFIPRLESQTDALGGARQNGEFCRADRCQASRFARFFL